MIGMRRSSESGLILLHVIGMILILLGVVGLLMSTQPLEVLAQKQLRVKQELEILAQAMKRYASDVIRVNYYDSTASTAHFRRQFMVSDLSVLRVDPGVEHPGDKSPWKGPYIAEDFGQSKQYGMTLSSSIPHDPWGQPYTISFQNPGDVWSNEFTVSSASPEANGLSQTVDMYPIYKAETLERAAIVKEALHKFNKDFITTAPGALCGNTYFSPATISSVTYCSDGLEIFNRLKLPNATLGGNVYLPDDPRLMSDAWGFEMKGYSSLADLSGITLPAAPTYPADNTVDNKIQCTATRFRYLPTALESTNISDDKPTGSNIYD